MIKDGKEMTERELLLEAIEGLNSACECLFESHDERIKMLGFMVDSALKLAGVILHDDCPLSAAANYQDYEEMVLNRHQAKIHNWRGYGE